MFARASIAAKANDAAGGEVAEDEADMFARAGMLRSRDLHALSNCAFVMT